MPVMYRFWTFRRAMIATLTLLLILLTVWATIEVLGTPLLTLTTTLTNLFASNPHTGNVQIL